jgi:ABC-type lipoprotein export system ATPase subunit
LSAGDAPLVQADGVSKTFGSGQRAVVAVHDLTVSVPPGARIAVTGPSGSGKSTLVHLLGGLERPTTGRVSWPGLSDGHGRPAHDIGLVFQGPSLLPALTVIENAALPLVLQGVDDAEARERAGAALRDLDLVALADLLPEEISGGQAQRVAIARVLALQPKLIIADEPTGQLDQQSATHVVDVLVEAADRLGAALLIATHDLAVVRRLTARWLVRDGTVLTATATPERSTSGTAAAGTWP